MPKIKEKDFKKTAIEGIKKATDQAEVFKLIRQFFAKAYSIGYEFTFEELKAEVLRKEKNAKLKKYLIPFIEELNDIEYGRKEISQADLEALKNKWTKLIAYVEIREAPAKKVATVEKRRRKLSIIIKSIFFGLLIGLIVLIIIKIRA